jgi:signal transduction histidine kinase
MDATGKVIGISTIARDIRQRKQAEVERAQLLAREQKARQEAELASRTKDEFLATLSHELRTPLNSILGWSEILDSGRLSEEDKAQGVKAIKRSARLQVRLVEDILDVSRITTGKLRLEIRPVDLCSVVEGAMESVTLASQSKEIRLQCLIETGPIMIRGDADRLQQVIWNLLSNALKFTPQGGQVQVHLQRAQKHCEIIVSDTGMGITPEFLPYVFDRFRQGDQSNTREHGGLGLGLALVRHIVEGHGGSVGVYSPGEGQGTTFTITMPLMPQDTFSS